MRNSFTIRDNGTIQTIDYTIVRSKRRSIGFEVRPGGKITVRIPMRASVNTVKEIILGLPILKRNTDRLPKDIYMNVSNTTLR